MKPHKWSWSWSRFECFLGPMTQLADQEQITKDSLAANGHWWDHMSLKWVWSEACEWLPTMPIRLTSWLQSTIDWPSVPLATKLMLHSLSLLLLLFSAHLKHTKIQYNLHVASFEHEFALFCFAANQIFAWKRSIAQSVGRYAWKWWKQQEDTIVYGNTPNHQISTQISLGSVKNACKARPKQIRQASRLTCEEEINCLKATCLLVLLIC